MRRAAAAKDAAKPAAAARQSDKPRGVPERVLPSRAAKKAAEGDTDANVKGTGGSAAAAADIKMDAGTGSAVVVYCGMVVGIALATFSNGQVQGSMNKLR